VTGRETFASASLRIGNLLSAGSGIKSSSSRRIRASQYRPARNGRYSPGPTPQAQRFDSHLQVIHSSGNRLPRLPGSEFFLDLDMTIPTEPIGSIPRPQKLIEAFTRYDRGSISQEEFASIVMRRSETLLRSLKQPDRP
jgi:hypothetical protein